MKETVDYKFTQLNNSLRNHISNRCNQASSIKHFEFFSNTHPTYEYNHKQSISVNIKGHCILFQSSF
jgi:hypothetical protein